jgi:hypothetical protein
MTDDKTPIGFYHPAEIRKATCLGDLAMRYDFLKAFRYSLRQGRLKKLIYFIKGTLLKPVNPLNFFFTDCLKRCHGLPLRSLFDKVTFTPIILLKVFIHYF